MRLWIKPGADWDRHIRDTECVAVAMKKAGGPANSFCFQAS